MFLQDEWSTSGQNAQQCIGYNKHNTCTQAYSDARTLKWMNQKGYTVYNIRLCL